MNVVLGLLAALACVVGVTVIGALAILGGEG